MKLDIYEAIVTAIHLAYKESPQDFHNKVFTEGQLTTLETIVRVDGTLPPKDKTYLLALIDLVTPKY